MTTEGGIIQRDVIKLLALVQQLENKQAGRIPALMLAALAVAFMEGQPREKTLLLFKTLHEQFDFETLVKDELKKGSTP